MNHNGAFIGEVARQTGLSIHTIRFYEAEGLLPEAGRTGAGYRVFAPQAVEHLQFIRRAQQLGFSLDEIRDLLVLRDPGTETCTHVRAVIGKKIAAVRSKLQELTVIEKELAHARAECNLRLRHHRPGSAERCPVLAKLGLRESGGPRGKSKAN